MPMNHEGSVWFRRDIQNPGRDVKGFSSVNHAGGDEIDFHRFQHAPFVPDEHFNPSCNHNAALFKGVLNFLSSYSSPYSLIAISLIRNFWTLPSRVIGNSLTNLMYRGRLAAGSFARQY